MTSLAIFNLCLMFFIALVGIVGGYVLKEDAALLLLPALAVLDAVYMLTSSTFFLLFLYKS